MWEAQRADLYTRGLGGVGVCRRGRSEAHAEACCPPQALARGTPLVTRPPRARRRGRGVGAGGRVLGPVGRDHRLKR